MSRGFVKEEDQEEIPFVPPRAYLPDGAINYVTPSGIEELLQERELLVNQRDGQDGLNENEKRIAINHTNAVLQLLNERIATARLVEPATQPPGEVRFGARVTLKIGTDKKPKQYQIVGVDEADISKNKISFISPIARILTNKKKGDKAVLKLGSSEKLFEIVGIEY